MSLISFKHSGNFKKTERFLKHAAETDYRDILERYAKQGLTALQNATPKDSGETAAAWDYVIEKRNGRISITYTNSHINNGVNIAIILNYGHGTASGAYVAGRNYIDPAIQPVFDKMADGVWKEVIA